MGGSLLKGLFRFCGVFMNRYVLALVLFAGIVTACNPQIHLYRNNGMYYSIYGFLNASADTQFIRIEQLRDSMPSSAPAHLNVNVTLTDLNTNKTVMLRDSLFHFEVGNTHNYYTTEKIIPTHTYKLIVKGQNGTESSAQVRIPATFPKPVVQAGIDPFFGLGCSSRSEIISEVDIKDVPRLVAVNTIYSIYNSPAKAKLSSYSLEHLADTSHVKQGVVRANINYHLDICRTNLAFNTGAILHRVYVVIAAGNKDWPDFLSLPGESQTAPGVATNVKDGVGLLGGVVTDTVTIYRDDQPTLFSK